MHETHTVLDVPDTKGWWLVLIVETAAQRMVRRAERRDKRCAVAARGDLYSSENLGGLG